VIDENATRMKDQACAFKRHWSKSAETVATFRWIWKIQQPKIAKIAWAIFGYFSRTNPISEEAAASDKFIERRGPGRRHVGEAVKS